MGRDRAAVSTDDESAAAQSAASLQYLPHRSGRCSDRARRQSRLRPHAVGTRAVLVAEAPQGIRAATFNARVETVAEKPFFRDAFRRTRCLIPASGYYEWQDTATGKQPWYFTRADGEPMTFAGLWDEWKDRTTGEVVKSCTMLITEPNNFVAEVHDRMPVVLESKDFASWLDDGGPALLKPAANDVLQRWPVSRRVNSSRAPADDPSLIDRVEAT
jgi:putative SOS response-associated peptidase YedK